MTPPVSRLRQRAARVFSPATMERPIDPAIADVQAEYADAVQHGRAWRSHWVRLAGYGVLLKVMVVCGCQEIWRASRNWTTDDQKAVLRIVGFSGAAVATTTLLLAGWTLLQFSQRHPTHVGLLMNLIPQALPIAVPIGLMLGILYGLRGRAVSLRLTGSALAIAITCSVSSFVTLAWIMPAANQAFRVSVSGVRTIEKGPNELTLGELNQQVHFQMQHSAHVSIRRAIYVRWALPYASIVLAVFGLAVVYRRWSGRILLGALSGGAVLGYYGLLQAGDVYVRHSTLPVLAAAWLPNVGILAVSVALLSVSANRPNADLPLSL